MNLYAYSYIESGNRLPFEYVCLNRYFNFKFYPYLYIYIYEKLEILFILNFFFIFMLL